MRRTLIPFYLIVFCFIGKTFSQSGSADFSFLTGTGFNERVYSISHVSDSKLIVSGLFTNFNGATANRIARLNADGTIDNTFSSGVGFNAVAYITTVQTDGKILVGGNFTTYNGSPAARIIRLMPDGTIDPSFAIGTGFNNSVFELCIQSDGKILAGGNFTSYNGVPRSKLVRLNSNGTLDAGFNIGTGFDSQVNSLSLQPDGKIIVSGVFISYNGVTANRIIRLNADGTMDASFVTGSGFNNQAYRNIVQGDGKIIVGGAFTTYNGTNSSRIIRLNADGSIDGSFTSGFGFNNDVFHMKLFSDGKILVAGLFTSYNGTVSGRIAKLNPDGTIDSDFNSGVGFNNETYVISDPLENSVFIGGYFTSYQSNLCNRIVKITNCINTDTILNISACNEYVAPDGISYMNSGQYEAIIPNAWGCDSIITINLIIEQYPSLSISESVCYSYIAPDGTELTSSGIYNILVPNSPFCDSLYIIDLTVTMDTTVDVNGILLTSNATGVTYQWYDCNLDQEITGATSQNYTATYNGDFAVIITDGSCQDTSDCLAISQVGIQDESGMINRISPNPFQADFYLDLSKIEGVVSISINDMTGRIIDEFAVIGGNKINYELAGNKGVYVVTLSYSGAIQKTTVLKN